MAHPHGSAYAYDTPVVDLLAAVLERVSGRSLRDLADRELFAPLGGGVVWWRRDTAGVDMGGNDAFVRPRDLVRLGELFRRGGVWNGRRILSEAYAREAVTPQMRTGEPMVNHGTLPVRGYGLLWWALDVGDDHDAFAALGHGGQELLVFPRRELVVLMTSRWPGTSSVEHYRHLRALLDDAILPAFAAR